jgi:hypothetical protein
LQRTLIGMRLLQMALKEYKESCQKYPLSAHEIKILIAPDSKVCAKNRKSEFLEPDDDRDGWGNEYKYTSNSLTYLLELSPGLTGRQATPTSINEKGNK